MKRRSRHSSSGQALAVLALSVAVVLGATAVVIDGGNAFAQQRGAQNAADAAALAGAVVIAEKMGDAARDDADVEDAMADAFADNASAMGPSYYVDFSENVVGTVGRGGSIPSDAHGVRAGSERDFDTFIASIGAQPAWTASAEATALAGALRGSCSADEGCAIMPVTFSIPITTCDGSSRPLRLGVDWPLTSLATARADSSGQYMSIVPLCKNGPGGVGWLDMCPGNLANEILDPCNGPYDIPTWLHTDSGNANNVEAELNTYRNTVITVPMFDATCRDVPSTGLPADCTDPGNGVNLYYHIPRFAKFLLHEAYTQGDDNAACNSSPGTPYIGGNGGTSCFKGWFVRYIQQGRVGEWEDCDIDVQPDCMEEPIFGVQLVN